MRQLDVMRNSLRKKRKKTKKKIKLKNYDQSLSASKRNPRTKILIVFDQSLASSIKSLAVNKENKIIPTSRFFNGKMFMFTKLSLMSFIYVVKNLHFPNETAWKIYEKYKIKHCLPYHMLTNTDSTCLMFVFIWDVGSSMLDHEFWNNFWSDDKNRYYRKIWHISSPPGKFRR